MASANINHIHIGTKDLKKVVDFHSSIFGFKKKFDYDPGIFLDNEAGFLIVIDLVDEVPLVWPRFHREAEDRSEVRLPYRTDVY